MDNKLYKFAYHGNPVVAVPLFGDQPANARKSCSKKGERRSFGVTVDYRNTDAQKVFESYSPCIAKFLSL
ncbi:hypothetical protein P5673_024248 [Acropora cervicornis]|uniref:Uncharacterized protein n=1 Tax=Acropora cervicornis TaxID=6130 RepID=A0AAD9Q400_ACRCE|nr:hypothetical protein P5673_024248 [Acropora cervicornis]